MSVKRISIAIAALGGQGGGVLSNWIVELAEANGFVAQYTAIAGVAQRTGSTIYAIELFPEALITERGLDPVLSLMPVKGDVDICLASELMEAGRAVNRGIVTPDKTTLIASDHRVYAIGEKEQMGDGRFDSEAVREAIGEAASMLVLFDMEAAVLETSSVISSVLFGALAGSGALPFSREAYENTIRNSGRAVDTNLAGFGLGFENASGKILDKEATCGQKITVSASLLVDRIELLPDTARVIATYGVHRLVDYQDVEYAALYLDRLDEFKDPEICDEVARHLALWMGFEDVIRVADLKTRAERSEKIAAEIRATKDQIWYGHDYFHPRYEEFIDILPVGVGRKMAGSSFLKKMFSPLFSKGRIIRPKTVFGYLLLRTVANLRIIRRKTLRFNVENKRIVAWLSMISKYQNENPELAVELAKCPRLIKGYGDTHARGTRRFSGIMAFVEANENDPKIVEKVTELRDAALASSAEAEFNLLINKGMTSNDRQQGEFKWTGSS